MRRVAEKTEVGYKSSDVMGAVHGMPRNGHSTRGEGFKCPKNEDRSVVFWTGFYVESLGVMVRLPGDCTVLWLAVVGLTWLVVSYFETVIFYILMAKTVRLPLGLVLCCSVIGPRRSCTVAPCG